MKNFAEKIRSLISGKNQSSAILNAPVDFVKTKKGIMKELIISKQSGNLLGVYSRAMGEGMFLVTVEEIEKYGKEEVIVFNRYEMSGYTLSRTRLSIDEIQMVCPFNKSFRTPVTSGANPDMTWKFFKSSVILL